ncbi:hypothetical protein [Prolixibacter bellariivorans]|uniref:hypothetical protein n=1 Tax=Prolixibacter bellariivorans TaxID=314319 RepID=UPI0005634F12|nr:hypothetical protein [Prolixibacter bellariivorans]
MKKILSAITGFLLFSTALYSQQLPLNESYFINKYSLASAMWEIARTMRYLRAIGETGPVKGV